MFSRYNRRDRTTAPSGFLDKRARSARTACSAACLALMTLTTSGAAQAQDAPAPQVLMAAGQKVKVTTIPGVTFPWAIDFLPNGDALITERNQSTLRLLHDGKLDPKPITGLPPVMQVKGGPRGGVDVIVHPQYATNKLIYVAYWQPMPGRPEIARPALMRARYDGGDKLTDVKDIFVSDSWNEATATRITFGQDGKIYMVIGTAFVNSAAKTPIEYGNNLDAQDPMKDAGKVLRLNDDGSIPQDNPFVGNPKYKPEIYALGIRNSMGMFSEPGTGKLWLTDNGPRGGDEINVIKPGANYGWPLITYGRSYIYDLEGKVSGNNVPPPEQPPTHAPGLEQPFMYWVPSPSLTAITIYKGDKFPAWKNSILLGSLKFQRAERVTLTQQGWESERMPMLGEVGRRIRDMKVAPDGLIYMVTDERNGAILKVEPADAAAPISVAAKPTN